MRKVEGSNCSGCAVASAAGVAEASGGVRHPGVKYSTQIRAVWYSTRQLFPLLTGRASSIPFTTTCYYTSKNHLLWLSDTSSSLVTPVRKSTRQRKKSFKLQILPLPCDPPTSTCRVLIYGTPIFAQSFWSFCTFCLFFGLKLVVVLVMLECRGCYYRGVVMWESKCFSL